MHSQGCEKTGDWVAFRKENEACYQRFFAPPHFFNSPLVRVFCFTRALSTALERHLHRRLSCSNILHPLES